MIYETSPINFPSRIQMKYYIASDYNGCFQHDTKKMSALFQCLNIIRDGRATDTSNLFE